MLKGEISILEALHFKPLGTIFSFNFTYTYVVEVMWEEQEMLRAVPDVTDFGGDSWSIFEDYIGRQ